MATDDTGRLGAESDFVPHDADNMVLLGNAHIDNLMHMVVALGAEVWTGQQRVKVIETLLTKHGSVTTEMIEQYEPTEEEIETWAAAAVHLFEIPLVPTVWNGGILYSKRWVSRFARTAN